jgi:hypothetical protein
MFLLGADPEVFVQKEGRFAPANGLIPGTKAAPHPVPNGAVQVDGMALEFNINPAKDYVEFQNNLDVVFSVLKDMVPGYEVMEKASVLLNSYHKSVLPPEAFIRGCSPDLNAYTEEPNPAIPDDCLLHAVGGHLHVGDIFSEGDTARERYNLSLRLVRLLDKHVGVYSLLWDKDTSRRSIYGKAGSCRLKTYGVEYRTLSNAWLFNKKITKFVYDGVSNAVEAMRQGEDVENNSYRDVIDNGDVHNSFFNLSPQAARVRAIMA